MIKRTLVAALLVSATLCFAQSVQTTPYEWDNVAIHGGGFVSGIITHPTEPGLIYCRTDIGGAYRWDEQDKRWIPITDHLDADRWNYTGIESLAIDPSDANRVYLAAGTYTNNWTPLNGAILISDDRGDTWQQVDLPFKNGGNEDGRNAGERLQVDPNDGTLLYFGTRNEGLWHSTDRGSSWSRVDSFPINKRTNGVGLTFVAFDPASGGKGSASQTIVVGVSGANPNLYRSTDAGKSWKPLEGIPGQMLPNHGVIVEGNLYVTAADAPGPNGMTAGAVWRLDLKSGESTDISPVKNDANDKFGYCGVSVDPKHPQTIVVSTMDRWAHKDDVFRSTDGGRTWDGLISNGEFEHTTAPYTKRSTPHWTGDVELDPADPNHVLFVTGYGIWSTRNANAVDRNQPVQWTFDNRGLEETVVNDIIAPPGEPVLLSAMWDLDGFRHTSVDQSPADRFDPGYGRATSIDFAGKQPATIVRVYGGDNTHGSTSTDTGKTWTPFPAAPPGDGSGDVAIAADASAIVWVQENAEPFYSSDLGKTWIRSDGGASGAKVVADRADGRTFYQFDREAGRLLVSHDGGRHFTTSASDLPRGSGDVAALAGEVWLATANGIFRSTDAGKTFGRVGPLTTAYHLGFGKAAPGSDMPTIFANGKVDADYGFFRSIDGGESWSRINDDRHAFGMINAITGDPDRFGRVYVASANRGILYGDPRPQDR